jgi:hypothetical protein
MLEEGTCARRNDRPRHRGETELQTTESTNSACDLDPRFAEHVRMIAELERNEKLFPKKCMTCTTVFPGLSSYIRDTVPKEHVLEDCKRVMRKPYTMMYRHCGCGNTLILTLTEDILPDLDSMWEMLNRVAAEDDKPLREVVRTFCGQLDRYILSHSIDDRT